MFCFMYTLTIWLYNIKFYILHYTVFVKKITNNIRNVLYIIYYVFQIIYQPTITVIQEQCCTGRCSKTDAYCRGLQ